MTTVRRIRLCYGFSTFRHHALMGLGINLCSQGPGTEVTSPEVYESIESEQYVFPAVKEDAWHIKLTYTISDELLNPTKSYSLLEFVSYTVVKSAILGPPL
jgi:hypothetical protein